jgi:DNA (cytosine-5)-methyltransferase 1
VLRRLSFREVLLLQGFPADWAVDGTAAQRFKQVGNAVPGVFGELLGGMIRRHLDAFPTGRPVRLELPDSFHAAIRYTKRDHARNHESRVVHKQFGV